jgi:hypothetical protein
MAKADLARSSQKAAAGGAGAFRWTVSITLVAGAWQDGIPGCRQAIVRIRVESGMRRTSNSRACARRMTRRQTVLVA